MLYVYSGKSISQYERTTRYCALCKIPTAYPQHQFTLLSKINSVGLISDIILSIGKHTQVLLVAIIQYSKVFDQVASKQLMF